MGAIKPVGNDGDPKLGFWHRNKARLAAFIVIGIIITLITFVVLSFLDTSGCKKNKIGIIAKIVSALALSLLYAKVIHKHVSFSFGKLAKYPSFTGADVVHKLTELNKIKRLQNTIALYDEDDFDLV